MGAVARMESTTRSMVASTPCHGCCVAWTNTFQATGVRLLDTIDLHFYPDGIPSSDSTESDQRAILEGVRSFWDWTYRDPGGIGECGERCMGPAIALLPRMIGEVREFAPNMQPKFTVSEYAFGFDDNVYTAALAVAEVLSLLGYWDAYMGARWVSPGNGTKAEQAFALYLNYDGRGSKVLGDSVNTSSSASPNQTAYSIYSPPSSRLFVLLFNHDLDKAGPLLFLCASWRRATERWPALHHFAGVHHDPHRLAGAGEEQGGGGRRPDRDSTHLQLTGHHTLSSPGRHRRGAAGLRGGRGALATTYRPHTEGEAPEAARGGAEGREAQEG